MPSIVIPCQPRMIRTAEAAVITRLLQICAGAPPSPALLSSINTLVVREHCDCGQQGYGPCDSIFFDNPHDLGCPIASGIGYIRKSSAVELIVWARGDIITYLELEPFNGARRPISLPRVETIQSYPEEWGEEPEDDEYDA
jgi:hypothetical protein